MNKLITKFKQNRAANARKWKHQEGGILKGQYGLITDVDRRRDTTGEGIGSMPFFGAAKFGSSDSPLALFYGSKEGGPQLRDKFGPQIGAPNYLPGTVGKTGLNQYVQLMEKEAPNMFKLIAENPKSLKHLLSIGYGRIREGLKNFFKTGNKESLKELEDWAKRNQNIFVNKGEPSNIIPKGNLNYPSMENVDYTARGWTRPKLSSDQQWNGYIPEEFEGLEGIDRIITYHKKGGKAFHTGVNILDSNPKMSKAASRKVKKADDGTKLGFFNSNTGKAIGNTLMNGISAGFQAKQMNDAIKQYELASKNKLEKMMNGILADDSNYQEALQQMLLTKNENENISDTVVRAKAYDIAKQKAQKKLNDYKDEINQNIVNMKQHANEQTINNFSGIFNQGMSGVMSLLNKKQTVDNGAPSQQWTQSEGWQNYLKASGYNV